MISPDDTFVRYLDEPGKPDDQRPAIVLRHGSCRSWNAYQQALASIVNNQELADAAMYPQVEQLVDGLIVERRNLDRIGDVLTDLQLLRLANGLRSDAYLAEATKKNSASPSPLAAERSAETASPAAASA